MSTPKRPRVEPAPAAAAASGTTTTTTTTTTAAPPSQTVFQHLASKCEIKIVNVVATANLSRALNLRTIALAARNAEFNPDRFNALVVRFDKPSSTGLVFSSGKIVVTGVKSEADASMACKRIAAMVKKLGFEKAVAANDLNEFKVQNIVAQSDLGFPIQLEHLAFEHHKFASYEPEIFPGLIYRMQDPKLVCLIFVTGKIVFTGAKFQEDIPEAMTKLYPVLQGFRKSRYTTAGKVVDATKLLAPPSSSSS